MNIMQRLRSTPQTTEKKSKPRNQGFLPWLFHGDPGETDVPQRRWEDQPEQGELTNKEHTYHLWLCQLSWKAVPSY